MTMEIHLDLTRKNHNYWQADRDQQFRSAVEDGYLNVFNSLIVGLVGIGFCSLFVPEIHWLTYVMLATVLCFGLFGHVAVSLWLKHCGKRFSNV